jgi:broad specificity phosphatase PhoE
VLPGLREIEAGSLEKNTDHESHLRYLGTVFAWSDGELDRRMPAGPSGQEFFDRYEAAIAGIAAAAGAAGDRAGGDGTVAVVSHGAALRVWAGLRASNVEPGFAARHLLANTGIVALDGDPDAGWRLIHWDDSPVGGLALADPMAENPPAARSSPPAARAGRRRRGKFSEPLRAGNTAETGAA